MGRVETEKMKEPGSICPNCGKPLRLKGGRAKCRCGCELEFGVTITNKMIIKGQETEAARAIMKVFLKDHD